MKSVRSLKNQYLGINAHRHSLWQAEGGWDSFHTRHIVHLADLLKARLVPMGYTAEVEESLQIRRLDKTVSQPATDVWISAFSQRPTGVAVAPALIAGATLTVAELFGEAELSERPYRAVTIYPLDQNMRKRAEPVAWVELLSPTNKGNREDAQTYRAKRMELLVNGLVFVELDYLHETPPTFSTIPRYRPRRGQATDLTAHPYRIIVIDPRPVLIKGPAQVIAFAVDQPIPTATIPLQKGESLNFDFSAPYRKTFEESLYGIDVDYSQLPLSFDRYQIADQNRIAARMVSVLHAAQNDLDLETGPFPVKEMTVEAALAEIEALRTQV